MAGNKKIEELELPYRPIKQQIKYFELDTRFVIAAIGRQWGKSMITMLKSVLKSKPGEIYWWIEPTIPQSKIHFKRFRKYFKSFIIPNSVNITEMSAELKTGGTWHFKGADVPENLEGETLAGAVLDEAAKMKESVWYETVQPMLAVKKGWAYLISKPRGNNYFKRLFERANYEQGWSRFHATSESGPFFDKEEFERARNETPERIFRQEYLAEFLDDAGIVFRNVNNCIGSVLSEPVPGHHYFAGVDLAKTVDYTVITILNHEKKMVAFDRFHNLSWPMQKERIYKLCSKYNAQVLVDSTGLGDPIYDDLAAAGLHITGYKFNNQSKKTLIENLVLAFEHETIKITDNEILINELKNFELELTKSGLTKYGAPDGLHDDCVISLALASYHCIPMTRGQIDSGDSRTTARMYQ